MLWNLVQRLSIDRKVLWTIVCFCVQAHVLFERLTDH